MLIQVRDEVVDLAMSSGAPMAIHDALENMLRSFREGNHVLLIAPDRIDRLTKNKNLSAGARGALQKLRSRWSELAGLGRELPIRIEVGTNSDAVGSTRLERGTAVVETFYEWFSSSSRTQASSLVCENISDARFYLCSARALIAHRRWRLRVSAEPYNGGGSTTGDVFRERCESGRVVLCFVDSDKRHPGGPLGQRLGPSVNRRRDWVFNVHLFCRAGILRILSRPALSELRSMPTRVACQRHRHMSGCVRLVDLAVRHSVSI